jgi:hypothetical protein
MPHRELLTESQRLSLQTPGNLRSLVSQDANRTGDRNSEEGRVAPGLKCSPSSLANLAPAAFAAAALQSDQHRKNSLQPAES